MLLFADYQPRGTVPFLQRAHRPLAAISAPPRSILPLRGNAPPSARAPRAAVPSLFAFLMSLSLSALIGPSMRSIQLALYRQAAPGRPLLPFGGSGFTIPRLCDYRLSPIERLAAFRRARLMHREIRRQAHNRLQRKFNRSDKCTLKNL